MQHELPKSDAVLETNGVSSDLADRLLENDPVLMDLTEKIARWQGRLKKSVTPKQFRIYLEIEDAVNERLLELVDRIWAERVGHGRHGVE